MRKINKFYALFEDISSGFFMLVGMVIMFYEVVMRYVFDSPTTWINEVSTIMVVWGVLLGLSLALRDNHHISVDILYVVLPPAVRKLIDYFANLMGIIFCLLFTYNAFILARNTFVSAQLSIETNIPEWIYYVVLPISGLMFMIRFIENIWHVHCTDYRLDPAAKGEVK